MAGTGITNFNSREVLISSFCGIVESFRDKSIENSKLIMSNLFQPKYWEKIKDVVSENDVKKAYQQAMFGMARLNKTAAKLMHKFNAHAATDVTGFGILGHAENLAANQKAEVSFVIESLPIYTHMTAVAKASPINFKLLDGYSAETSGRK